MPWRGTGEIGWVGLTIRRETMLAGPVSRLKRVSFGGGKADLRKAGNKRLHSIGSNSSREGGRVGEGRVTSGPFWTTSFLVWCRVGWAGGVEGVLAEPERGVITQKSLMRGP